MDSVHLNIGIHCFAESGLKGTAEVSMKKEIQSQLGVGKKVYELYKNISEGPF